jgi:hypothetical protein
MGWFDNLWRRRQGRTTETPRDTASARAAAGEEERPRSEADALEDDVAAEREDVIMREPRLPPGTG